MFSARFHCSCASECDQCHVLRALAKSPFRVMQWARDVWEFHFFFGKFDENLKQTLDNLLKNVQN
jgi:hypothetical protein